MSDQKQNNRKIFLIPNLLSAGTENDVITPRVRQVIQETRIFFTENVRTSRRFISSLQLGINISDLVFYVLDKRSDHQAVEKLLHEVPEGENIGVMSEAGLPCIADPGNILVDIAHNRGWNITPLSGPSSIMLALAASGFNGQEFSFNGYLPLKSPSRSKSIKKLEEKVLRRGGTEIFMETPYRNNQLLQDVLNTCGSSTRLCIAADVTGPQEFIRTQTIAAWKKNRPDLHKIPAIFLLGK